MTGLILLLAAHATAPASIEGTWRSPGGRSPGGNSIIAIALCGGAALCGTVAWGQRAGQEGLQQDTNQLAGMQLLTNLSRARTAAGTANCSFRIRICG